MNRPDLDAMADREKKAHLKRVAAAEARVEALNVRLDAMFDPAASDEAERVTQLRALAAWFEV